jgi:hypothetical protein
MRTRIIGSILSGSRAEPFRRYRPSRIGASELLFVLCVGSLAEVPVADEAVRVDQVAGRPVVSIVGPSNREGEDRFGRDLNLARY